MAVLGASLYTWTHSGRLNRLYYTEEKRKWVHANWSSEPAIKNDELWVMEAECKRPFFEQALNAAKTKLEEYTSTKRSSSTISGLFEESRLKARIEEWERRIANIKDKKILLSEVNLRHRELTILLIMTLAFREIKRKQSKLIASKRYQ